MAAITADEIIHTLGLEPLHGEGGFFARSYTSNVTLPGDALPLGYGAPRLLGTAIYYLLTPDSFSALHRLTGDELYHFYAGDPVDLLLLDGDESGRTITLGTDLRAGMRPQALAPSGTWHGSSLRTGGAFALLGTTMSPGYDDADFELGDPDALVAAYPACAAAIRSLTR